MSALLVLLNLLLFLLLAPLFEGVVRKITARIQSRQGPPLIQPYYDFFKLLGKDNLSAGSWAFHLAPIRAGPDGNRGDSYPDSRGFADPRTAIRQP